MDFAIKASAEGATDHEMLSAVADALTPIAKAHHTAAEANEAAMEAAYCEDSGELAST